MERWIVPTAWAYSSKCNNRRLEHPFYGIWNLVLQDLIADLAPHLFVIPQYQIDSIDKGPVAPDESIATAAQANATEFTPDFSMVKARVILRPAVTLNIDQLPFNSWNNVTIKAFIVPCIAELKHPPTRRAPSLKSFVEDLIITFQQAYRCLEEQVENAFAMQSTNVNRIILFACVGEWWSWKIATRDRYITDNGSDSSSLDSSNSILPSLFSPAGPMNLPQAQRQQPSRHAKNDNVRDKYTNPPSPPLQLSDKLPYRPRTRGAGDKKKRQLEHPVRYEDLGEEMEQVRTNVEHAKPLDNDWSKFILLGSPASNQRLFLIHRFLGTECATMLDVSDDVDDDEEEEQEEQEYNDNEDDTEWE